MIVGIGIDMIEVDRVMKRSTRTMVLKKRYFQKVRLSFVNQIAGLKIMQHVLLLKKHF